MEMDDTAAEAVFIEQLEVQSDAVGQGGRAATHDNGIDEQVIFVDDPNLDGLGGELSSTDTEVPPGALLEPANRDRVKLPLDTSASTGDVCHGPRVDDLVSRLPDFGVLRFDGRGLGTGVGRFPVDHRLVHPPPEQMRPDRSLKLV